MRVLHLSTAGWNERDGIARAAMALVARLRHEAHLAVANPSGEMFAGLHQVPGTFMPQPWSKAMRAVVADVRPDLLHIHGGDAAAILALAFRDLPVVLSVYGRANLDTERSPLAAILDARSASVGAGRRAAIGLVGLRMTRRALRQGTLSVVCSPDETVAASLADVGPVVLARGAAALSHHRAVWSDSPLLVFAGKAEAGRGIDDLLEAFRSVRRVVPSARLRLHLLPARGDAPFRVIPDAGVEVTFRRIDNLDAALAEAQLAVVPFRVPMTITPALVAAEAMSVGLPVVATDISCLTPLVQDGRNGAVVAPRDIEGLASSILRVISERARWEQLSAGARDTIDRDWSWDRAAAIVDGAYALAIDRARQFRHVAFPSTTPGTRQ